MNLTQGRGQGDEVANYSAAHVDTTDDDSDARAPHYHSNIPTSDSPSSPAETLTYDQQQQPQTQQPSSSQHIPPPTAEQRLAYERQRGTAAA